MLFKIKLKSFGEKKIHHYFPLDLAGTRVLYICCLDLIQLTGLTFLFLVSQVGFFFFTIIILELDSKRYSSIYPISKPQINPNLIDRLMNFQ